MTQRPQAVVIAGPNGAGKTSAAPDLLRDAVGIKAFVNADAIAQGLAEFSPQSAAFASGRIMMRRLRDLARNHENLAFESTLAGRSTLRLMKTLVADGYETHIFYLWLPSPAVAVARVRRRVETGGHDVPETVIRRRFWKSLINFDQLYRLASTTWRLYDGSLLDGRPLIAYGTGTGAATVLHTDSWREIRQRMEKVE